MDLPAGTLKPGEFHRFSAAEGFPPLEGHRPTDSGKTGMARFGSDGGEPASYGMHRGVFNSSPRLMVSLPAASVEF